MSNQKSSTTAKTKPQASAKPHAALDEYDPEVDVRDDTIIGRAFMWSLLVIVIAAAVVTILLLLDREPSETEAIVVKDAGEIAGLQTPEDDTIPDIPFSDITESAGIDFVHFSGATGEKLLPETMGAGVAFFDYDNDGDPDLLFTNGDNSLIDGSEASDSPPTVTLYQNDGDGNFVDVTDEVGLGDVSMYGMGCAVGDVDNDGWLDLFLTAVGPNKLLRNEGGYFVDVTEQAGVAGDDEQWSTSAGFFDYDNDGDVDLFVCNYIDWSPEKDYEVNYTLNGVDRAYGPPNNYTGAQPYLYRNEGDGTFTEVSRQAGLHVKNPATDVPVGKALAVTFFDPDGDGDLDIFVANDTVANFLYRNNGNGRFDEVGSISGIAYDSSGNATGAMGTDAAYLLNDSTLAVGIGNFANEATSLYLSQNNAMSFADQTNPEGVGSPSRQKLSFGLFFFDADLDGWQDMFQANGHLEDEINDIQPSQHYLQEQQLFWNCGPDATSCYSIMPGEKVGDLNTPAVGRGAAFADVDGDGDLDIALAQVGAPAKLFRNDQQLGHNWLRIKLQGDDRNADAIGALVELTAGDLRSRQRVMPTRSYLSQVELPLTFGLGDRDRVDRITITWPGGRRQVVENPPINEVITIEASR